MKITEANTTDGPVIGLLYHDNHRQSLGRLKVVPDQRSQTFVVRYDNRINGYAVVTLYDDGVHRYGILHVLEVHDPRGPGASDTARTLVQGCRDWLSQFGIAMLLAAPQMDAWLIVEGFRDLRRLRTVGPEEFTRSPDPPGPIKVARQAW